MKLVQLYLRSRRVGYALALLTLVAVATRVALWFGGGAEEIVGMTLVLMPLAAAVVISTGARAPFGESEQTASYPLPMLRLGHLLALLAWAALGLALGAVLSPPSTVTGFGSAELVIQPSSVAWWLARNLLGFAGLALLAARWVGSGRAWTVALLHAILTVMFLLQSPFGWPLRPVSDPQAITVACVLLAGGLAVIVRNGARDDGAGSTVV